MKFDKRQPDKTLATINECIYCSAKETSLAKEHIIPRSLGGNLVLKNASCLDCSKITSKWETSVSEIAYKILRASAGFPTRRPKNTPKEVQFEVSGCGKLTAINVALKDAPITVLRPNYALPPFLKELPLKSSDMHTVDAFQLPDPDEFTNRRARIFSWMRNHDPKSESRTLKATTESFKVGTFERMIVKIGIGLIWAADSEFAKAQSIGKDLFLTKDEMYDRGTDKKRFVPKNVFSVASTDALENERYAASVFSKQEGAELAHYAAIRIFPHIVFPTYLYRCGATGGTRLSAKYYSSEN